MAQTAILKHKHTGTLFRHLAENRYVNIVTGVEGEVPPETAQKIFTISTDATDMFNRYENIELLIRKLNLKMDGKENL